MLSFKQFNEAFVFHSPGKSESDVSHYNIVQFANGRVVGKAMTRKGANRAVDKHDNNYGSYAHKIVPVYKNEPITEAVQGVYNDESYSHSVDHLVNLTANRAPTKERTQNIINNNAGLGTKEGDFHTLLKSPTPAFEKRVKNADTRYPILLHKGYIVDGSHRLASHHWNNNELAPVHHLSDEDMKSARIHDPAEISAQSKITEAHKFYSDTDLRGPPMTMNAIKSYRMKDIMPKYQEHMTNMYILRHLNSHPTTPTNDKIDYTNQLAIAHKKMKNIVDTHPTFKREEVGLRANHARIAAHSKLAEMGYNDFALPKKMEAPKVANLPTTKDGRKLFGV